ncbi:hypothetical protein [Rhizobium oryzicola]|uniref:Uncharacterized protein n=1 Tax=Rhizobium oryzicola TaxID=1232668 RepID=A0ABT8T3V5_9HYPH|nr:hypothetical protein [Rhizobium oryzicola]MDO1585434.1 hypothetical protein [Rhizobium oryzicola]
MTLLVVWQASVAERQWSLSQLIFDFHFGKGGLQNCYKTLFAAQFMIRSL